MLKIYNIDVKEILDLPEKVSVDNIDIPIMQQWEKDKIYQYIFDETSDLKENVFSIDTPPPTVSGSLHVGHVFSYTHTDLLARYMRMQNKKVFYPMGFDDNGLPTERRVQNYYGVRPDLTIPYQKDFKPPFEGTDKNIKASDQVPISRLNFIELCEKLSTQDEIKFKELWMRLGISVDWNQTYQTIGKKARKYAQKYFIENYLRGEAYQSQAPGLWDVTFQTAVAQAELESREYPGYYHKIIFTHYDSNNKEIEIPIETTRPELLISCVALIAHPDDERYSHLFGKTAYSPLFNVEVPILAHSLAEIDKGAGIAMCCTFGDQVDIEWWKDLQLPLRSVMGKNGRLQTCDINGNVVDWVKKSDAIELAKQLHSKTAFTAREITVEALITNGKLIGTPEKTVRNTNFFEKGDKPLEIVTSRQWYIKNGGKDKDLNNKLQNCGEQLEFFPDFMKVRYLNWVQGLNNDWLISRQRYFGVAFPIWYKCDDEGSPIYEEVILPDIEDLPIDPTSDVPKGYHEDQRDQPKGFSAEVDVMDTWATSSLTPQIATDCRPELFPMSIRPQGQDIIRTWLFSTVVRSHLENNCLPWKSCTISGWILDPDRKKMSKSKGNVVTPMNFIEQYGADAVRYWAAKASLGVDTTFDEGVIKIGRRLAMKLLNATKFVLQIIKQTDKKVELDLSNVTYEVDKVFIKYLDNTANSATICFEDYDHSKALDIVETTFWTFCDDYLELVKKRSYDGERSATTTLSYSIDVLIRLLAPFIPFAAEEAWSWFNKTSVHTNNWPKDNKDFSNYKRGDLNQMKHVSSTEFHIISDVLLKLRKIKSNAKVSPKMPVSDVFIKADESQICFIKKCENDLINAANIVGDIKYQISDQHILELSGTVVE